MYELPSSLLTANPINRYLINSPMLPDMKRDVDGGMTPYVQNESPGKDKAANWLPAPKGPFWMSMLYWPKDEAPHGKWTAPQASDGDVSDPVPGSAEANVVQGLCRTLVEQSSDERHPRTEH
jgi:hypothetical protein